METRFKKITIDYCKPKRAYKHHIEIKGKRAWPVSVI